MAAFNDNFSKQASIYAQYRPSYPHELFDYLQSLCPEHEMAWDCGTGNGQSAVHLAEFFKKVYASDPSEAQIIFPPRPSGLPRRKRRRNHH